MLGVTAMLGVHRYAFRGSPMFQGFTAMLGVHRYAWGSPMFQGFTAMLGVRAAMLLLVSSGSLAGSLSNHGCKHIVILLGCAAALIFIKWFFYHYRSPSLNYLLPSILRYVPH